MLPPAGRDVHVSAPGKIILFGEHAVVYNEPAVAAAIDLRARVSASVRPDAGRTTVNGHALDASAHAHAYEAVRRLQLAPEAGLAITIRSAIPSAAGLGSSAALSVGLAACMSLLNSEPSATVDEESVARTAYDIEWAVQGGRGSPTDTTTSAHGNGVLVDRQRADGFLWEIARGPRTWDLHHLDLPDLRIVVGNTGVRGKTSEQVAKVARFVQRGAFGREVVEEIGSVTREARGALAKKDIAKVGTLMTRNHKLLTIMGVSTRELDRLCRAAEPTSWGAKLTGSGGGGSMIALTDRPEETARAIGNAGGTPHIVRLGGPGVTTGEGL
ncbi:MAG: mevalonate kinase [Thermoplasmatota archaeon]